MLLNILTIVYVVCALALFVYSSNIAVLLVLWWLHRDDRPVAPQVADGDWPSVTVQIPVYNEYTVISRVIGAVSALDYPRHRLRVQVLDDSDDETRVLVARLVARWSQTGLTITHLWRADRTGYKAGALANGLQRTDDELIAIFDADFVPPPGFLRAVVPHFVADPHLGIVQARWGHLNAEQSLITRSQAMSIDAHFVVEQTARSRGNLLVSFNGTGGVWRRSCVVESGGWSGDTVAEDLDLSYRAQMQGWRFLYLPDVEVPAEIPPQIAAYKRQQARWAKGTTQNLLRHGGNLWRATRLNLFQKFMGTLHLCQYLPPPLLLLLLLLTPPLMLSGVLAKLPLAPLGIGGLAAPLMYVVSQRWLYGDWRRLAAFPLLLAIGGGVVFNNTVGVAEALLKRPNEFKRTPKFSGQSWQHSRYALRPDWTLAAEALLAAYALAGAVMALRQSPGIAPFLFVQAYGFSAMVVWGVIEGLNVGKRTIPPLKQSAA